MNHVIALTVAVVPFLCSCASNNVPYRPDSKPEKKEFLKDVLNIYPGDVRRNLSLYTNDGVGWVGIISKTDATEGPNGLVHAVTTFEHHYFDWQEDRHRGNVQLSVSPRGEGTFRTEWEMRRTEDDVDLDAVEKFAGPGALAIVYGVPERVEDGTVVLRYRYLRLVAPENYNTNQFDYGRADEPIRCIDQPAAGKK